MNPKKSTSVLSLALIVIANFQALYAADPPPEDVIQEYLFDEEPRDPSLYLFNSAAQAYLGNGGAGIDYDGQFGKWVYVGFNGGINEPGTGLGDGSDSNNRYASIGLNRPTSFRQGGARASWVVFSRNDFDLGESYTVSFDVVGDPAGNPGDGRFWLTALAGYGSELGDFIQARGQFPSPWTNPDRFPFSASGNASVSYIAGSNIDGVALSGTTDEGSTNNSFTFTYDTPNVDIGFAVGTVSNAFGITNFRIFKAPPPDVGDFNADASNYLSEANASGYLGTGGSGIDYSGQFGKWVYHDFFGGINSGPQGAGDGSTSANRYSSLGLNRPKAFRAGGGRATWIVFESSEFVPGARYRVSYNVVGDTSQSIPGNERHGGRFWLAALEGYDTDPESFIQVTGSTVNATWDAYGRGPFEGVGSASVTYLECSGTSVPNPGDRSLGPTENAFTFTYDTPDADIGFAVGTTNVAFGFTNFRIERLASPEPVIPGYQESVGPEEPNFIIMIADDHRWDASGYAQDAILNGEFPGRTARFPWMSGTTPTLDSLAAEGVLFREAFAVASLCSPSRATMLTGLHPQKHGIIDNRNDFPPDLVTYANILQDNGYLTGYFGKWHMGNQRDRPGFDRFVSFIDQGSYCGSEFVDENGVILPRDSFTWVDDRSPDYAVKFINEQVANGQKFAAVIGFKTPHLNRTPPRRTEDFYVGRTLEEVDNLGTKGVRPPYAPTTNRGRDLESNLRYLRTIAGIDDSIKKILDTLDQPGWSEVRENTVVIYISDQGLFHNEHGLEDKRAPYEESIRIPLIVRYPRLQPDLEANLVSNNMALTLDLAPTILDLANLPVPEHMQGRSLKPLVENPSQPPSDWRSSFFFTYNFDSEFVNSVPEYIAIRNANGDKYVEYSQNSQWNELFTGDDPYEIDNEINNEVYAGLLAELRTELARKVVEEDFMRVETVSNGNGLPSLELDAGESILYALESSVDLQDPEGWSQVSEFQGSGGRTRVDLISDAPTTWDVSINSDLGDYGVGPGNTVADVNRSIINVGSSASLRNAVLVFKLPAAPQPGILPSHAQIRVSATRKEAKNDIDIYALGFTAGATDRIPEYHTSLPGPNTVRLEDSFLDLALDNTGGTLGFIFDTYYASNLNSGLTSHLRDFYQANPNYDGEQYIHLRLSPSIYNVSRSTHYRIKMADGANTTDALAPELRMNWQDAPESEASDRMFFRVRPASRFRRAEYQN